MNVLKPIPNFGSELIAAESASEPQSATETQNESAPTKEGSKSPSEQKKKKALLSRMNKATMMWIRRIHLFSGLFMLPWVLLYGFTALLFNHSTWFSDSRIENVKVAESDLSTLPLSDQVAEAVVSQLAADGMNIELDGKPRAIFTRSAFASYETESTNETFVVDLNTGNGYRRIRDKPKTGVDSDDQKNDDQKKQEKAKPMLAKGLPLHIETGNSLVVTKIISELTENLDTKKEINLSGIPTLEFNAVVDGELKRLRFSQQSNRRRGSSPPPSNSQNSKSKEKKSPTEVKGTVVAVGENPRQMSWRSYLLRLHMAHGYPNTQNARYWWAYAVDAMFLCMVFWGISGVFMWWQIKRTRTLGFILLAVSAVIATYLAFAMHWQLVNG